MCVCFYYRTLHAIWSFEKGVQLKGNCLPRRLYSSKETVQTSECDRSISDDYKISTQTIPPAEDQIITCYHQGTYILRTQVGRTESAQARSRRDFFSRTEEGAHFIRTK